MVHLRSLMILNDPSHCFFEVNISWVVGRDLKGQNDSAEALIEM